MKSASPIGDCISSEQLPEVPDPQIVDVPVNFQIEEILPAIEAPTFTESGQVPIVNPEQSTDSKSFDTRQHDKDFSTVILPSVDRRLDVAAIGNVSPTVTESGQDPHMAEHLIVGFFKHPTRQPRRPHLKEQDIVLSQPPPPGAGVGAGGNTFWGFTWADATTANIPMLIHTQE
ncbi:hypothetical protein V6N13_118900 [Hibiscus sabdariffa]